MDQNRTVWEKVIQIQYFKRQRGNIVIIKATSPFCSLFIYIQFHEYIYKYSFKLHYYFHDVNSQMYISSRKMQDTLALFFTLSIR